MRGGALIPALAAVAAGGAILLAFTGEPSSAEMPATVEQAATSAAMGEAGTAGISRDECGDLPGFAAFRAALFNAVENRNVDRMIGLAHPSIELSDDGAAGLDEFRRRLAEDDRLWTALQSLEAMGCASDNREDATMPWAPAHSSGNEGQLYLVRGNVRILAKPEADAATAGTLNGKVVQAVGSMPASAPYTKVTVPGRDLQGYVATAEMLPVNDVKLAVTRGRSGWVIDSFTVGS